MKTQTYVVPDPGTLVARLKIVAGALQELRFLTLEQAAGILQVSKRTLQRLIQRRQMPSLKIGGQWRIPESEFMKWVAEKMIPISDDGRKHPGKETRGKSGSAL
jgi:excisionase family DNA binding protein